MPTVKSIFEAPTAMQPEDFVLQSAEDLGITVDKISSTKTDKTEAVLYTVTGFATDLEAFRSRLLKAPFTLVDPSLKALYTKPSTVPGTITSEE